MTKKKRKRRKASLVGPRQETNSINPQQVCPAECAWPSGRRRWESNTTGNKSNPSEAKRGHLYGRLIVLLAVQALTCALAAREADDTFTIKTSRGQLFQGIRLKVDDGQQQQPVVAFLGKSRCDELISLAIG